MIKHNQDGAVNGLAVSLVLAVILLIGAIVFGVWAYGSRQDYKNNTDQKIAAAEQVAKQKESTRKDAEFAEEEKNPLKTYHGPQATGSLVIAYPKTWSGYVDDSGRSSNNAQLDGYFYPGVVPSVQAEGSIFALRVSVVDQKYSEVMSDISNLQKSKDPPPPTVVPYALPQVPDTVGVKVTGTLPDRRTGTMVILPLRDQTLEIWTEGNQFAGDFNNIILPNFKFSP